MEQDGAARVTLFSIVPYNYPVFLEHTDGKKQSSKSAM